VADDKQIEIVLRAKNLTDEAFKKVQAAVRSLDAESEKTTSRGSASWGKWFGTITGGVAAGNLLSDAFKKVGGELANIPNQLIELGSRGADVRDVKGAFEGLTTSVGQTSQAMLGQLRTAFGGTVADFDLMKSANEGLSKGVKFTAEDMGVLGKAARVMADRVGGDAKQSFDALISGIADGREKTLKQLPLNFQNIETAIKAYADSLDTEVSKLTEAQKQEALRQAVLKESQRLLAESGEIENDFADKVAAGTATVRNWTDSLAESVSQHGPMIAGLGGMAQAATTLTPLLGMTGLAGAASTLAGVLMGPVGLVAGLAAAAFAFTQFKVGEINAQATAYEQASQIIGRAARNLTEARDIIRAFEAGKAGQQLTGAVTSEMADAWNKGAEAAGRMKTAVTSLTIDGFGPGLTTTKSYTEIARELRAEVERLPQATKNEIDAMRLLGKTEEQIHEKTKVSIALLKIYTQSTKDQVKAKKDQAAIDKEIFAGMREYSKALNEQAILGRKLELSLYEQIEAKRQLAVLTPPLLANYEGLRNRMDGMIPSLQRVNDALGTQQQKIRAVIEQAKQMAREEIQKGLNFGAGLSQSIIGAIQGGGDVGKSVGAFLGDSIGKSLGEKLAKEIGGKLGGALGGMIGPLGAIGGQLLGGLVDKIFSTKGRDTVKEWVDKNFGGSFDALRKHLLQFGAEGERVWIDITQKVGKGSIEQAQAAIAAYERLVAVQKEGIEKTGQAAKDAAQKEIDAQAKVVDEIKGRRDELASHIKQLNDRIGAEAEEAEMGVQERLDRAERDRLLERQALVQKELDDAEARQRENVERFEEAIRQLTDALSKLTEKTWKIPVEFNYQNAPPSGPPSQTSDPGASHAAGAYIREDHVASVHAGELIGPVDFMSRALAGAMRINGGGAGGGTVIVEFGTREVARALIPEIASEVKRLRLA
jgi:hypothetical protein